MNIFKKTKAFTLAETLTVVCIMGVIAAITVASTVSSDDAEAKKIIASSQSFYSNAQTTFINILTSNTQNGNMMTLEDEQHNLAESSDVIRDYFVKYMDGENEPCSSLKINSQFIKEYLNNASCASFQGGVTAGFVYDSTCSLEASVKEYLLKDDDNSSREVNNVCVRIVYGWGKKSKRGIFGKDIFTIAFGKRSIK